MVCDLSNTFEKIGKYYMFRDKQGLDWPVLYCPICGKKIDYEKEEDTKEVKE